MPGRASRSAAVAALRFTAPPDAAPPEADPVAPVAVPGTPTAICWPSPTTAARFTDAGSAAGSRPPAAATASATREPDGRVTSPGRATWPTTETTTVLAVSATCPTDGVAGASVVDVVVGDESTGSTWGRSSQVQPTSSSAAISAAIQSEC